MNVECAISEVFTKGGEGGRDLAQKLLTLQTQPNQILNLSMMKILKLKKKLR